jgi:hypothetical protein
MIGIRGYYVPSVGGQTINASHIKINRLFKHMTDVFYKTKTECVWDVDKHIRVDYDRIIGKYYESRLSCGCLFTQEGSTINHYFCESHDKSAQKCNKCKWTSITDSLEFLNKTQKVTTW